MVQTLALQLINLVLSFVILLWNVEFVTVRPTSSTALKGYLPKATEYTKGEVFTFITLGSLPLRESFLGGDVTSLLQ